jgi:hypothetical protein
MGRLAIYLIELTLVVCIYGPVSSFVLMAWEFNDSIFPYYLLLQACTAIYLAARDFAIALPASPRPWWEVFVGPHKNHLMATVGNAILGLGGGGGGGGGGDNDDDDAVDVLLASKGFVASLVKEGESFNDPGSFLWDHQKSLIVGSSSSSNKLT